jgi:4-alpha-glucanotransferase
MQMMRASGLLVHPTSLPGRYGIGDLGPSTRLLLDFLSAAKQHLWQTLPLGPTGYGDSPYASFSAFAGNHQLIAPGDLAERGWLTPSDLDEVPEFAPTAVDYGAAGNFKMALLRRAFERFQARATAERRDTFASFREGNQDWLDDYTLFMALKAAHEGKPWTEWEPALVGREPDALADARRALADDVQLHAFLQWLFFSQWEDVRAYAHERGISIVGDLAIFVAHDSADVWSHRDLFSLDERGNPSVVAGVPPDYFSRTGQRWGNPLYRWDVLASDGYAWWVERVRATLRLADVLRLDHFRGFYAYWEVPASCPTAVEGHWVRAPGKQLFETILHQLGEVQIIAEDLGKITAPVRRLRETLGLPGMKVLQFAFGSDARNKHLPHWFTSNTAVYTGTHDNDTACGWFQSRGKREREFALSYLDSDGREFNWDLIRAALASVADIAVVPLQDVLGLGSEARMNLPGRAAGNWTWRCTQDQLTEKVSARLAALTALYAR